jgi:hypothetical protein
MQRAPQARAGAGFAIGIGQSPPPTDACGYWGYLAQQVSTNSDCTAPMTSSIETPSQDVRASSQHHNL